MVFNITLPESQRHPAAPCQFLKIFAISIPIARQFAPPVCDTALWNRPVTAMVQVPKTAVHEDNSPKPSHHNIWTARKGSHIEPISMPTTAENFANRYFWPCVFAADTGHHRASFSGRPNVHQQDQAPRSRLGAAGLHELIEESIVYAF